MENKKSFETELLSYALPWLVLYCVVATFYLFYFSNFPFSQMKAVDIGKMVLLTGFVFAAIVAAVFSAVHHKITRSISELALAEEKSRLDKKGRTLLARKYMEYPGWIIYVLFFSSLVAVGIIASLIYFLFVRDKNAVQIFFIIGVALSYMLGLCGFYFSEKICSRRVVELVKKGLDLETVWRDKFYGKKIMSRLVLFLTLVSVATNWLAFFIFLKNIGDIRLDSNFDWVGRILVTRIPPALILNCLLSLAFSVMFYVQIVVSHKSINSALETILGSQGQADVVLPSNLGHELAYNFFITNELVLYYNSLMRDSLEVSQSIWEATDGLSVLSRETAETSRADTKRVRHCSAAMGEAQKRLETIAHVITYVSVLAADAKTKADEGGRLLQEKIREKNMTEILSTNLETISGLKSLTDSLSGILASIADIDAIAEKIKIIAFNAELQTTKATEYSETFHILGSEFRRIASATFYATETIKGFILSIQEFSENLIVSSEVGTQKIRKCQAFFDLLSEKIGAMKSAIELSEKNARSIQCLADDQNSRFEDINTTFGELGRNFAHFSETARETSGLSEKLRVLSNELKPEDLAAGKEGRNLWGGGIDESAEKAG